MDATQVLVAGGGPVGLLLALELHQRGIEFVLVERNPTTTAHPKMDITNGRTMEHFRRLHIIDDVRAAAVPPSNGMDVVWCTAMNEWELARFSYPSVDDMRRTIGASTDGTLPAEPGMRISQIVLEPLLRSILEERAGIDAVRFGWALESFEQDEHGVTSVIRNRHTGEKRTVRSLYLAGCDGASSRVREQLGVGSDEWSPLRLLRENGTVLHTAAGLARGLIQGRRPPNGRLFLIHFSSRDAEFLDCFGKTWHVQSPDGWILIGQNDEDTWTLHVPLRAGDRANRIDARSLLFKTLGREFDCEIHVANAWRPRLVIADSFGRGRVWLAGDAVHQVIPSGGYGMNSGVGDAVDLAWKLAAAVHGWAGPRLLASYETERHPVAERNRAASARHTAIRIAIASEYSRRLHRLSVAGHRTRARHATRIRRRGNLENEALGIEIGYAYADSPVIAHEPGVEPPNEMERYVPSTVPGVRPPSLHLADGRLIFDLFGPEFTLLRFADDADVGAIEEAAAARHVPLDVVDVREGALRELYQRDLVLVRPDQHVAWRGDQPPADALALIDHVRGA